MKQFTFHVTLFMIPFEKDPIVGETTIWLFEVEAVILMLPVIIKFEIFPNKELIEIPANHAIFQKPFLFANGLPKIHEHDGKRPQAFGIFIDNRLVLLYTFECDLGDGWEDPEVHNDPIAVREKALKMGANIINYIFNN